MINRGELTNILKSHIETFVGSQQKFLDSTRDGSIATQDARHLAILTSDEQIAGFRNRAENIQKAARAGNVPDDLRTNAAWILEQHGYRFDDATGFYDSPEFRQFAWQFAQVDARANIEAANRLEGKPDFTYTQFVDGLIEEGMPLTLKQACDDYIDAKVRKGVTDGTLEGYRGIIKSILACYGDDYQVKRLNNLELQKYISYEQGRGLKNSTALTNSKRLRDILKIACINHGLSPWQYQVELKDDSLVVTSLSTAELNSMYVFLNKFGRGVPWQYWITLIALLTGLRQEEVTDLDFDDVAEVPEFKGVWAVTVREGKTENANRIVPVPDILISLGFLVFWEERKQSGEAGAFMFHYNKKYERVTATKVSDWFSNAKDKMGIADEKRFHSLRHNFADSLKQGKVMEDMREELCGHKITSGKSEQKRYTEVYRMPLKKEAIEQAAWDCDFTLLKTWSRQ
jgi:integrase